MSEITLPGFEGGTVADTPTDAPGHGRTGTLADAPAHGRADTPTDTLAHVRAGTLADAPDHARVGILADVPAHGRAGTLADAPAHGRAGTLADAPAHGRAGTLADAPDHARVGILARGRGDMPGAHAAPQFYLTEEHHPENGTLFGFWLYLMSDCLVFACLFAVYAVLGRSYAGGPTGAELFDLPLVAVNTSLLLLSSITYGFAMLEMQRERLGTTLFWLGVTGLLGAGFIGIELHEFAHLIQEGAGPQRSAFLSSFFTLVGTHGLHVTFGIVWLVTLMVQSARHGLIPENRRRLMCLSMFWHFLDVVWIGVFTFVYLMGVLP